MSKSLNLCQFIGNIGKDVDTRYLPSGAQVAQFSIAVGRDYKDKQGNKVERTEWVNCVCFGALAEVISKYCHKGSKIYVAGEMVTEKWEKDGVTHYTTKVQVLNMQMLDGRPAGEQAPSQAPSQASKQTPSQPSSQPQGYEDFDDDIPFMSLNNMIKGHLI